MTRFQNSGTLCCALGLASAAASAAEWRAQASFSASTDVDTNRYLVVPAETSHGVHVGGTLDLERVTENRRVTLRPRFMAHRYDGDFDVLDSDDFGAVLEFAQQGERTVWNVHAGGGEDSTLAAELADTGFVDARSQRRELSAGTDVAVSLGERSKLAAGASYIDVDFDRILGTGLRPYRYPAANLGYSYDVSGRMRLGVSVDAGRLELPLTGTSTDNYAARLTWSGSLTERLKLEVSGGINRSESAFSQAQGLVYGINGSWNTERTSLTLALDRDVEPSSIGRMVQADSASLQWQWAVSEQLTVSTFANYEIRENLLFGPFTDLRDYATLDAALGWRLDSHWNLQLSAGAARQSYQRSGYEAEGAHMALSVNWAPRLHAVSR